ncbi:DUF4386 family protein [Aldersonia kunmingensis]|uniref:DUF4386 family protein n=1 Tax=Aldersonia kunmingensis TaxID=408066 RepID=UPI000834C4CB|nr:DUF4386 family protein [Aldersonia kunmingensis]
MTTYAHTDGSAARRVAAVAMIGAAGLAIAGFTALGSIFQYPDILAEPAADILELYRANQAAVSGWFFVLLLGAAMLAPIGYLLGRLAGGVVGRWIAGLGIAAAAVQVIGLSRWILFVPGLAADAQHPDRAAAATDTFETLHVWLGTVVGETIGYALTATFTVLVAGTVARGVGGRWLSYLGFGSAALIATGVVIPLGVELADLANFAGYVLWCGWLIAMGVALLRGTGSAPSAVVESGLDLHLRRQAGES